MILQIDQTAEETSITPTLAEIFEEVLVHQFIEFLFENKNFYIMSSLVFALISQLLTCFSAQPNRLALK